MRKALTTAELMIAMTIIGVIAVLVLPSLIENYQNKIYLTKLKKSYMAISNAVEQACVDSNVSSFKLTPYAGNHDLSAVRNFFNKYLNVKSSVSAFADKYEIITDRVATEAELDAIDDADLKEQYASGDKKIKERKSGLTSSYLRVVLNDGQALAMMCETASNNCYIFLDVNGKDEPNTEGRDMFCFRIDQITNEVSDFKPASECTTGTATIGSSNIANGAGCLARIMSDNWNMNY